MFSLHDLFRNDFMPHGFCFRWNPEILWLHVYSDGLIAISYYLIPIGLFYLIWRRRDLAYEYHWIVLLFSIFIFSCGTTHLMSIWTLWHGAYGWEGIAKAVTALASFPTAVLLLRTIPAALKLPSAKELRRLNEGLEQRVLERTTELNAMNRELEEVNATLRRANSDLNQFASSASHDLREPIRMMSIYTQLLQRRIGVGLDEESQTFLSYVAEGASRVDGLVQDLLNYTQLGHEVRAEVVAVDSQEIFNEVLSSFAPLLKESGATVTVDSTLPVVPVAGVHLSQIFQNLLGNAAKYRSPDRPLTIRVGATLREGFWQFSVEDNGLGIDPEYRTLIFGLFKRLHNPGEYPGSGVGLAICSRVVELYGGAIWVEDAVGPGSRFCFTLPHSR